MAFKHRSTWDLVGCYAFARDSPLGKEYTAHGLVFGTCEGYGMYNAYMPGWMMAIDGCLFYSEYRGVCAVCATMFVYNNKALKDKWSSILTLDPAYVSTNKDEFLEELRLAGYEAHGCKVHAKGEL